MSSLTGEEDQRWVPTHVQVTVLRGRGLRGKGKHGTSDAYTVIQLGREKYSTCVAEKTTEPEWKEECTFDLQPGVLERGGSGSNELALTVTHRALIGLDVFLGQALIPLDKVFHERRCVKNEWYRLNSKTGKKEKERGDIQVTIQFTRNNLTASMYDLVMKDKGASTFGKLKERMRGKRRSSDDSSSGVLPGGHGSLGRMRQRLPSDGGGEEDYEDDEGGEVRRSKMRTFFLRGKLRKSSDARSSTSLGSESSESSSRGGSLSPTAGISVVVSDLSNSPSNSSNLTADDSPDHTGETSPKSASSLQCEFGDDAGEITIAVPRRFVCVNGSHAYGAHPLDPGSGKPPKSGGPGLLQKHLPLSVSLQNLSPPSSTGVPKGPVGDGRRWSFDKPDEEEKAAIAAALEQTGPVLLEGEEEPIPHKGVSPAEGEIQGKKQRKNLSSAGKGQSQPKDESERVHGAAEDKHKGWFGSKESHSNPSLVVSPKLEPCTYPPQLLFPPGRPLEPASLVPPLHHSNPFCRSLSTPSPTSPCNPFFSFLQHNPFYEDMLMAPRLKPSLPPLPYLSSSSPPIARLVPQTSDTNPTRTSENPTVEYALTGTDANDELMARVENRPLPPTPGEGATTLIRRSSNPFVSPAEPDPNPQWDESFEAFAAGRLQSPGEPTAARRMPQDIQPLTDHRKQEATLTDAGQCARVNDASHHQAGTECGLKAQKVTGLVTSTNPHQFDSFTHFLETIPEHDSFERDDTTLNSPNSRSLAAAAETNDANGAANASDLTHVNTRLALGHTSSVKYDTSSSDPASSGLGRSAEEEILSCLSSYSDKFSPSSSEEQNFDIQNFEDAAELAVVKKPSESEADASNDLSLDFLDQPTVIQPKDGDEKARSPPSKAGATMPLETQQQQAANRQSSPHPVKPLTTAMLAEDKRTEGRSVLEKLRSTIHPGRSSLGEQDTDRKKCVVAGAGSYYHLNHGELVALLAQREAELQSKKAEFQQLKCLLAKREVELKKLKPQIKDLEDYIDTLLVRIMEQKPTLLQVRSKLK
ncbi:rab11 family-interacting protein 1 [Brachionichthys hirsutus]|uniref:rab11 family-interacting protein 1 n=1 Tax=Brachionichthys hirsutus TaxID=412623 RepID=UPI00360538E8